MKWLYKNCPAIGSKLAYIQQEVEPFAGEFEAIRLRNKQIIEIKGWAYNKGVDPACIVLTNQGNMVRGIANYGLEHLDVKQEILDEFPDNTGWQGYGRVHKHDKMLKVYMLNLNNDWIALKGRFQIQRHPLAF